jgi:hypothetical protein
MICYTCHATTPALFFQGKRGVCAGCRLEDSDAPARAFVSPPPKIEPAIVQPSEKPGNRILDWTY